MGALKISVLCVFAAVSFTDGMVWRSWHHNDGRMFLGRRYFDSRTEETTTEQFDRTTEQFYQKESSYYSNKQKENVEKVFILSDDDDRLNWSEARNACLESGRVLANPTTPEQREKLRSYIRDNNLSPPDVFSGYWLGGHREDNSGPFKWENGEEVTEGGYNTGWMWGEPNYDGENCLELKGDGGALGFNNFYCNLVKRYICEETVSQEHDKNLKETNNQVAHEEENKNVVEIANPTSKSEILDEDEFGTIIMAPRKVFNGEVDTESPFTSETSDSDEFGIIVMAPKKVISEKIDTDSPLTSETSDYYDEFVPIVMAPKKVISEEVDTESPLTSETSDYYEFGPIVMAPTKIINEEVDTESPLTSDTLDYYQFAPIVISPNKIVSEEVETESPLTSETLNYGLIMAPKRVISEEIDTDSDEFGSAAPRRVIIYAVDTKSPMETVEPEIVDAAPSGVDSNESRLLELISGDGIVAKTEPPTDSIASNELSLRKAENDETVDHDVTFLRKLSFPEDVQTETLDGLIVLDNHVETESPDVDSLPPTVFEDSEYVEPIDDYYGDLHTVDNWGVNNDDYELE